MEEIGPRRRQAQGFATRTLRALCVCARACIRTRAHARARTRAGQGPCAADPDGPPYMNSMCVCSIPLHGAKRTRILTWWQGRRARASCSFEWKKIKCILFCNDKIKYNACKAWRAEPGPAAAWSGGKSNIHYFIIIKSNIMHTTDGVQAKGQLQLRVEENQMYTIL